MSEKPELNIVSSRCKMRSSNSSTFTCVLFIVICELLFVTVVYTHIHKCTPPNGTEGTCLPRELCPHLKELFENFSPGNYEFLRLSQCGYADMSKEVCCPPGMIIEMEDIDAKGEFINYLKPSIKLPEPGICGVQNYDSRIYGGSITDIKEFPWMALLSYGKKSDIANEFACGGALIHLRYVLTAAHCVTGPEVEDLLGGLQKVRLGEHNIDEEIDCEPRTEPRECAPPPIDVKVVRKVVHPGYIHYSLHKHNDIALLELEHDVKLNDYIRPICLANNVTATLFEPGKIHSVCGWGLMENNTMSPIKRTTKLLIEDGKKCASVYSRSRYKIHLGPNQICAGGAGLNDSCRGDSGGPLMVEASVPELENVWFMTGLVSMGPNPCANKNIPGVYTNVLNYYDWIVENML